MLDNASPLMKHLVFNEKWNVVSAGIIFMLYAMLSALLILQMLIGVLCDVVSSMRTEQRDAHDIQLVKQELLEDLRRHDNGDGLISQKELLSVLHDTKAKAVLRKLNISRAFVLELQKLMFTHAGQQVPIRVILQLLVMCRGHEKTTMESMSGGILCVIHELTALRQRLEKDLLIMQSGKALVLQSEQTSVPFLDERPRVPPLQLAETTC